MGKVLVVAEKPTVGRDIARVLKASSKGDGFLFSENYVVSWAVGHLITLCDPEDYDAAYKKWRLETLPIIPTDIKLKAAANTKKQLGVLKKLMNDDDTDEIICATDSGREGELIFRYIYKYVKCKKPFKRLWISSMTDTSIKNGFANLKKGSDYDNLYLSAKCRSEADWLVGINASRVFTIRYNCLLSIGRVQTPTLAIIVYKQREIDAFVPRDFYEVKALFEHDSEAYTGIWIKDNETKIFEKEKAEEIYNKVLNKEGYVKSIENEEKKQPPPLLYDLTELQRDANKKYGFSAKKTLELAQDLYEKRKLITYPRTDSRYLSDDMIPKLKPTLEKLGVLQPFVQEILQMEKLPVSKRIVDNSKVTDHHAIIPTEVTVNTQALSADEMKIYDLIARRFVAVFLPNYIYSVTKIITCVEDEDFITKGTTVKQYGWMELYKDTKKNDGEEEILPSVSVNDKVSVKEAEILKKRTEPPKPYNEAGLLSAMENAGRFVEDESLKEQLKESGIGTPATRAAIIERLIEVGYIIRKGKTLLPTDKGVKLIEVVPEELRSPETTGKWEKGLSSISKGNMDNVKFMKSIERYVNFIVSAAPKTDVVFPEDVRKTRSRGPAKSFGKCPNCADGQILENTKAYYCSGWKNGCKTTIWKDKLTGPLTDEIIQNYKIRNTQKGEQNDAN